MGDRARTLANACPPQKLGARPANAKGWTCQTAAEYRSVIDLLRNVIAAVLRVFAPHAIVAAENLLLRHQLIMLRRSSPRPRLKRLDRWLVATLATRTDSRGVRRASVWSSIGLAAYSGRSRGPVPTALGG
jgi:hypothetical protein